MRRGGGAILVFTTAVLSACASAAPGEPGATGQRPRDDADTRAASVRLAQASLAEGEVAREHYEEALAYALNAIERDPNNPRAYLIAGQAAVGAEQWVQADTMFVRAVELYPRFEEQIAAEREEGWVMAYNLGAEAMNAGDHEMALERFGGADLLYQGRPEARLALAVLHTSAGDMDAAIASYRGALEILEHDPPADMPPEQSESWERDRQAAAFNLANLLSQAGRYAEAAQELGDYLARAPETIDADVRLQAMTARAAFLAQAGEAEEAERIYEDLLARGDLGANEYFQIGVGLFNAEEYDRAAEAFASAARQNPHSRDAFLNLVQSLYTAAADLEQEPETPARNQRLNEMYDQLLEAADQVRRFDPLNRNLLSFTLRAYRAKADIAPQAEAARLTQRSQEVFRQYQAQPFEVSDLSMAVDRDDRIRIQGVFTNLTEPAGGQVALQFTVVDATGRTLDTSNVAITVPAANESVQFSTTVDLAGGELAGWRYELVR